MSIKIMSEVWEYSQHSGSTLLCLLAIADHANDDGVAYPGAARLASRTRVNKRHIFKLLEKLIDSGELAAFNRAADEGGFTSNAYAVVSGCSEGEIQRRTNMMRRDVRGIITWGGTVPQNTTPTVPQNTTLVSQGTLEPSVEPSIEPIREGSEEETPKPSPEPRPRNLLFDMIAARTFDIPQGTLVDAQAMKATGLGGWIGKILKAIKQLEPGITPERLLAFYEWYALEFPGCSPVQDTAKFAAKYAAFISNPLKHAQAAAPAARPVEHYE